MALPKFLSFCRNAVLELYTMYIILKRFVIVSYTQRMR